MNAAYEPAEARQQSANQLLFPRSEHGTTSRQQHHNPTQTLSLFAEENVVIYMQLPAHTSEFSCKFDPGARQRSVSSLAVDHSAAESLAVQPLLSGRPVNSHSSRNLLATSANSNNEFNQTEPKTRFETHLPFTTNSPNFERSSSSKQHKTRQHRNHDRILSSNQQPEHSTELPGNDIGSEMSPVVRPVSQTRKQPPQLITKRAHSVDIRAPRSSSTSVPAPQRTASVQEESSKVGPKHNEQHDDKIGTKTAHTGSTPAETREAASSAKRNKAKLRGSNEASSSSATGKPSPSISKTFLEQQRSNTPESTTTTTAMALHLLKATGIDTKLIEEALEAGAYDSKPKNGPDKEPISSVKQSKPIAIRRSRSESVSEKLKKEGRNNDGDKQRISPVRATASEVAPPVIAPSARRRASAQPRIGSNVEQQHQHRQPSPKSSDRAVPKVLERAASESSSKSLVRSQSRGSVRSVNILNSQQQHDTIHESDEHKHQHHSAHRKRSDLHRDDQNTARQNSGEERTSRKVNQQETSTKRSSSVSTKANKREHEVQPLVDNNTQRRHSSATHHKHSRETIEKHDHSIRRSSSSRSRSTTPRARPSSGEYSMEGKEEQLQTDDELEAGQSSDSTSHGKSPHTLPAKQTTDHAAQKAAAQLDTILQALEQQGIISVSSRSPTISNVKAGVSDKRRSHTVSRVASQRSGSMSSTSTTRGLTRQASAGGGTRNAPHEDETQESFSSSEKEADAPLPPRRDSRSDLKDTSNSSKNKSGTDKYRREESTNSKRSSRKTDDSSHEPTVSKSHHQLMKEGVEWQAHMSSENSMLTQAVKLLEKLVSKKQPPFQPKRNENGRVDNSSLLEQLQQILSSNVHEEMESAPTRQRSGGVKGEHQSSAKEEAEDDEEGTNDEFSPSIAAELDVHSSGDENVNSEENIRRSRQKPKKNHKSDRVDKAQAKKVRNKVEDRQAMSSNATILTSREVGERHQLRATPEAKRVTETRKETNSKSIGTNSANNKDDAYAKRIAELKQEYLDITARNKAIQEERKLNSRTSATTRHRPTSPARTNSTVDNYYETLQPSSAEQTQLPPVSLIHAHCFTEYLSSKLDRELREAEECQKRVRSNPVPAHVKLPLYEMMQRNEEQRKLERHEQSVEKLKIIQPFHFVQQTPPPSERQASSDLTTPDNNGRPPAITAAHSHKQHSATCPRAARTMPRPPPAFRARPVPQDLFNDRAHEERAERRRLNASRERVARMEQMKRESSLPPNMERRGQAYFYGKTHTKNQLEMFSRPKHQPEIHASVPDFEELHRQEDDKIEERKRAAAVRTTIPQPFDLATERRAKEKEQNSEESQNKQSNNQRRPSPQLRRVGSSLTSISATHTKFPTARQFMAPASILPRETWSTRMRRAHSQKRMLTSLRDDVETRMRELTGKEKQILMRLKMHGKLDSANSNLDYQMQLNAKRAERMRQIVHNREQTYEKQLAQMQYKVDELRPFLFERQGQKTPQTQKQLVNKVFTAAGDITKALRKNVAPPQHMKTSRTFDGPPPTEQARSSSRALGGREHQQFVDSMNTKHGFTIGGSSSSVNTVVDTRNNLQSTGQPEAARHVPRENEMPQDTFRSEAARRYSNRQVDASDEHSSLHRPRRKTTSLQTSDENSDGENAEEIESPSDADYETEERSVASENDTRTSIRSSHSKQNTQRF